ncbi:MAG: alcohol dehydrogenase [Desulfobacteraceae bacterium]|nr:MAG: alcohol dehydrogenase [Desulfobacteraceae bacterium]
MKQVVQEISSGITSVREIPAPFAAPGHVVVSIVASLVSAGTERYVVDLARASLFEKARRRPDQVRRVLEKVRTEGLSSTLEQVRAKLDDAMPLGYSASGVVIECGAGVQEFKPADRVATAVPHASLAVVGKNLCARIPDSVGFEAAAYTSVASIGLEGVRLARVTLGESVLVIGLGLIGQMCIALLRAHGCRVFGTDIDPQKVKFAREFGADHAEAGSPAEMVKAFSRGFGVDAVIITAATSSNEPIVFAADACRPKGRIVLVGVTGLNIPRAPFFEKELEFTVSSSLGPGRNDPAYEEKGIDYPIGHARWTAQRNMQACLDLMAAGKLPVEQLTTHRFPIERAPEAYNLITSGREPYFGIVLEYPQDVRPIRKVDFRARPGKPGDPGLSLVGAGNFARLVMIPSIKAAGGFRWRGLCTAKGLSAEHNARAKGFAFATTDVEEVLADRETGAVLIATRHNEHARLVVRALQAGKHVFVEKPLCITPDELEEINLCLMELGETAPILMVGFNRRFALATERLKEHFRGVAPLSLSHRFASGPLPPEHWTQDPAVGGGRIIGEACHAIDTCVAIAGSAPVKVYAESVADNGGTGTTDDRAFITIRHENGSISSVSYQAGGDKAIPAERIEVFGGGRVGMVENWDRIELWQNGRKRSICGGKDKGHRAEFKAFLSAVRNAGEWPVPWHEIRGTTWASLAAVQSLRHGYPVEVE